MGKFVVEILKEVNEDPSKLAQYKDNNAFRITLEYAFDPAKKFKLPEGKPPFKPDGAPLGMNPGNFQQEVRRFAVFLRDDIGSLRRETLFIQLLEGIHPSEADVLIAVKDQKLSELYPNVTLSNLQAAGWFPELKSQPAVAANSKSQEAGVESTAKRGRGRPAGAKNKSKAKSEDQVV